MRMRLPSEEPLRGDEQSARLRNCYLGVSGDNPPIYSQELFWHSLFRSLAVLPSAMQTK
jgi:hypothetical protein